MTDTAIPESLRNFPGLTIDDSFPPIPVKPVGFSGSVTSVNADGTFTYKLEPQAQAGFCGTGSTMPRPVNPLKAPSPAPVSVAVTPSKYAEFRVTADAVVFCFDAYLRPHVLLIKRKKDPFKGCWCFPGGHVDRDEDLLTAAHRELQEETGLELPGTQYLDILAKNPGLLAKMSPFVQVGAYGQPGRDPRGQYVTIAYTTVLRAFHLESFPSSPILELPAVVGADDATEAAWIPIDTIGKGDGPLLGFDHGRILLDAISMTENLFGDEENIRHLLREAAAGRREKISTPATAQAHSEPVAVAESLPILESMPVARTEPEPLPHYNLPNLLCSYRSCRGGCDEHHVHQEICRSGPCKCS